MYSIKKQTKSGYGTPACRFEFFLKKACHLSVYMLLYSSVVEYAGVSEWQTRQTQNLLWATTYGFKSHRRQFL